MKQNLLKLNRIKQYVRHALCPCSASSTVFPPSNSLLHSTVGYVACVLLLCVSVWFLLHYDATQMLYQPFLTASSIVFFHDLWVL